MTSQSRMVAAATLAAFATDAYCIWETFSFGTHESIKQPILLTALATAGVMARLYFNQRKAMDPKPPHTTKIADNRFTQGHTVMTLFFCGATISMLMPYASNALDNDANPSDTAVALKYVIAFALSTAVHAITAATSYQIDRRTQEKPAMINLDDGLLEQYKPL